MRDGPHIVPLTRPLMESAMARSRSPVVAADVEKQLFGVWTLASFYSEFKATGEKRATYGKRPNGYTSSLRRNG
jgi:hypothetical protein